MSGSRRAVTVIVLYWASLYLFVPIMAPLAERRGADLRTIGWMLGAYGLVQLLLRLPLGLWSDRLGRRRPFVLCAFVAVGAAVAGMAAIADPPAMVVFRGLTGAGASAWVILVVHYAALSPTLSVAESTGRAVMAMQLTILLAGFLGGVVAEQLGWTSPFWLAGVLALGGLWLSRGLVEQPARERPPELGRLVLLARRSDLLVVAFMGVLCQGVVYMTTLGFTPVYGAALGASRLQLGALNAAAGIPAALASLLGGRRLIPRYGYRSVLLVGFVVAAAGSALLHSAGTVGQLLLVQIPVGLGTGGTLAGLMALSIQTVAAHERGTAMGFFQAAYALGMFGGPALGGALGDLFGLQAVFAGAAVLALAGAVAAAAAPVPAVSRPASPGPSV